MVEKTRIPELDVLRGMAAFLVVFFHFNGSIPDFYFNIFKYGTTGVDLFFIISGFVIFMSIEKHRSLYDFWWGRFIRLFPVYWFSILIAICVYSYIDNYKIQNNLFNLIGNLLMLQPLFKTGDLVGSYWTLYIELTFYLFISLIIGFKRINKIETIIFAGLMFTAFFHGFYLLFKNYSQLYVRLFIVGRNLIPLISHFNMFAAGIIFYNLFKHGSSYFRYFLLFFSWILTLLFHSMGGKVFYDLNQYEHLACITLYFLFFGLIINKKLTFLNKPWLIFWGSISYSLYLIHQTVGMTITRLLAKSNYYPVLSVIVGLMAAIIFATVLTFFIEKPIMKLLRKKYQ